MPTLTPTPTSAKDRVVAGGNAAPDTAVSEEHVLSVDEQKAISVDEKLGVGEVGFLPLDADGKPKGSVKIDKTPGEPEAAVVKPVARVYDEITTPSGAPLTTNMQPNPDHYDPGLAERNPAPKRMSDKEKESAAKTGTK